jgi:hypothetical protein
MSQKTQKTRHLALVDQEQLTAAEARIIRMACLLGAPDPLPPDLAQALCKLRRIETEGQR